MPRIAFIGAGSLGFTRTVIRDILTFERFKDATLVLMDVDQKRLDFARKAVNTIVHRGGHPAKVVATLNRAEALKSADAVICTILAHPVKVWRKDIEIPKSFGIDTNCGDTRSVSGIFRALRTIPVMVSIARDIQRYCPDALLLNYTNPMAMLCRAMQRTTDIQLAGLCHSVQGTAEMLARWIGAPMDQVTFTCAGINHQAFFVDFKRNGKDVYPAIRKAVTTRREVYNEEIIRNEMFLALGYYVTESSGHNSEYNWWFRKRPDLIKKYCLDGTGWNPGRHRYILGEYLRREHFWQRQIRNWFAKGAPMKPARSHEYASYILNAFFGGQAFVFNGNVPNDGLIDNLPQAACVEAPIAASKGKLTPIHVGALPASVSPLVNISVAVEEMAVQAALTGDPTLVYQATVYDPLCASVLSLREIKQMVARMLKANKPYLPQFKNINI